LCPSFYVPSLVYPQDATAEEEGDFDEDEEAEEVMA
jgi:hypothetical protein